MKRSERIYRWLLRLYPRDFRDEYGEEMSLLFRARASEGSVRLWLQVLGEIRAKASPLRMTKDFDTVLIAELPDPVPPRSLRFPEVRELLCRRGK